MPFGSTALLLIATETPEGLLNIAEVARASARIAAVWAVAGWILDDPATRRQWWLIPLQDALAFLFWVAGYFGRTIVWRGRRYALRRDGRFEPLGEG